jgi:hypothetical protein
MKLVTVTAIALALSVTTVDARNFNCGRTMCRLVGIKNCGSLALALQWAHKFPRTTAQPGAVVVQRRKGRALGGGPGGHVSLIVSVDANGNTAIVRDDKGTYRRNIKKNLVAFVSPQRAWTE